METVKAGRNGGDSLFFYNKKLIKEHIYLKKLIKALTNA